MVRPCPAPLAAATPAPAKCAAAEKPGGLTALPGQGNLGFGRRTDGRCHDSRGDRRRKIRDGKQLENDVACPTANLEPPMAARGTERTGSRAENA